MQRENGELEVYREEQRVTQKERKKRGKQTMEYNVLKTEGKVIAQWLLRSYSG